MCMFVGGERGIGKAWMVGVFFWCHLQYFCYMYEFVRVYVHANTHYVCACVCLCIHSIYLRMCVM